MPKVIAMVKRQLLYFAIAGQFPSFFFLFQQSDLFRNKCKIFNEIKFNGQLLSKLNDESSDSVHEKYFLKLQENQNLFSYINYM